MCLRVSVQSDMSNLGCRNKFKHSVHHTESCSQDRNDCHLLALKFLNRSLTDRSLNRNIRKLQISGSLITDEHCNLRYCLTEVLGTCLFPSDVSNLVFNEWMIHNYYFCHNNLLNRVPAPIILPFYKINSLLVSLITREWCI